MAKATAVHDFDLAKVPAEHRQEVEALIPRESLADEYINRTFAGNVEDFNLFDGAFGDRHNIMMVGPTGAGKTMAGRAYAAFHRLPFGRVEFNGAMDPATTIGTNVVNPDNGLPQYRFGEITLVCKYGGCIFLDEVNNLAGRMTATFHGLLDASQSLYIAEIGRRVVKSPRTVVFAAYNPRYHGTNLLNEAFINRFSYTIDPWGYDSGVEDELIGAYTPTLLARVRDMRNEDKIQADIGTNVMEEFIQHAGRFPIETAIQLFLARMPVEDRAIMSDVLEAEAFAIGNELGAAA